MYIIALGLSQRHEWPCGGLLPGGGGVGLLLDHPSLALSRSRTPPLLLTTQAHSHTNSCTTSRDSRADWVQV